MLCDSESGKTLIHRNGALPKGKARCNLERSLSLGKVDNVLGDCDDLSLSLEEVDNVSGDYDSGRKFHFEFEQELLFDIC